MSKGRGCFARLRLVVLALGCLLANPMARAEEVIRIGGTGSALGMIRILGAAFEETHPGIKIKIAPSLGSSGAVRAVAQGALEIGLVSRNLTTEEYSLGVLVSEYAKTPFLLVAGNNVPIFNLGLNEIIRMYRGEVQTWSNGERIRLILRPAADADTVLARTISPEMSAAIDAALSRPGLLVALTNQEALEIVARTAGAICFSSLSQVMTENPALKILSFNRVMPTTKNLSDATYPMFLKLSFIVSRERSRSARDFLEFVHSAMGQELLTKNGNIPMKP